MIAALCRGSDLFLKIRAFTLFLHNFGFELFDLIDLILDAVKQVLLLFVQYAKLMLKAFIALSERLDFHRALVQFCLLLLILDYKVLHLLVLLLQLLDVALDLF